METTTPEPAVILHVESIARFGRAQLVLRLLVCAALGLIHQSLAGILGALYLLLPLGAALLISRRSEPGMSESDAKWLASGLEWFLAFYAYMLFVTDKFPLDMRTRQLRFELRASGRVSLGGALARLVTTIPHAIVLAILGLLSALVSLIAAIAVLLTESYPDSLRGFQTDVIRYLARVFAYHASLVDGFPAFSASDRGGAGSARESAVEQPPA